MLTRLQLVRAGAGAAAAAAFALAACSNMPMGMQGSGVSATLAGSSEVPPTASSGTGSLSGSYDKGSRMLHWTLTYSGLTGPATAAHFHGPAPAGQNAGVVVPFGSAASGSSGMATLTEAQAADLLAGRWYVNVHTAANPSGEIRGQVAVQ